MKEIIRFYRLDQGIEYCFNLELRAALSDDELKICGWLLAETFSPEKFSPASFLEGDVVEVGPRLNVATPWNTNALSILRACGIDKVVRIERSRRYASAQEAIFDRMTEMVYAEPLTTFETGIQPEKVYAIPLMEKGPDVLAEIPGISMDDFDRRFYYDYFAKKCGRNPTIVEIMDLNGSNSQHSRHDYFKGRQEIDGVVMPKTLMEIVQSTLKANSGNSMLAFCDNSSAIKGYKIRTIVPANPGQISRFKEEELDCDILFTAETHNFPSGVAPFPGAETGTGGRIRDVEATGRGGLVIAGTAGYCVGNLLIPGYDLPWEDRSFVYPQNLASPIQIEIEASNGASDYGNKFGEPVIQGFTRSFGMRLPNGERIEWLKPIMFTGGIGQLDRRHLKKAEAEKGMKIIGIGGRAYRIGFGGGAASSLIQGEQKAELDFNAVQRGDAEMEQKMNRVIRACIEMGIENPIISIHDQGAVGPANVLKELVEKAGGKVEIRKINSGDSTLSVLELWVCEYQERNGLLIHPERLKEFKEICQRENVLCEELGEVTGDGIFMVHDAQDDSTPVHLHLNDVLGNMPQKTFSDQRIPPVLKPLGFSENPTVSEVLDRVLRNVAVGSKRFLTNKVDRSVTGLIRQQQCVGPLQLPLSNVAVVAQSHFPNDEGKYSGAAIAIGEQPVKGLVSPGAQGRMSVAEMLTNIVWAKISSLEDIKCSGNWMSAPKLPGEGAKLYDTATAMGEFIEELGIAVDGGKDSLSMATKVKESGELVKSPGQLVISGYCTVPDITKVVTPDFKEAGNKIYRLDLSLGKRRLGGSALAHCYRQIGNECPDIESPKLLKSTFYAIQELIEKKLVLSGHDISDGGLIVTLLEMSFAGNLGFFVDLLCDADVITELFAEEAGVVVEIPLAREEEAIEVFCKHGVSWGMLGSIRDDKQVIITKEEAYEAPKEIFCADMRELRATWEETSMQIDLQTRYSKINPDCVREEYKNIYDRPGPQYHFAFTSKPTPKEWLKTADKPKVAIIREEGSNSDREMTSAFLQAGFEVWDVTMTDLLSGKINSLDMFRGLAFVGGFSYADVLDSAKGWAGVIRFRLWEMFQRFYDRPDTFSLGICNGCQLMALLGLVPWQGIESRYQPRFIRNISGRFESRFPSVIIQDSPAIMLQGMGGSVLGVNLAHGEGRAYFPDINVLDEVEYDKLAPIRYVDDENNPTQKYPFNPNGSTNAIAGLCSRDGRHLAMMPHPERTFLNWQWDYLPQDWDPGQVSPWLKMFQNARKWCEKTK